MNAKSIDCSICTPTHPYTKLLSKTAWDGVVSLRSVPIGDISEGTAFTGEFASDQLVNVAVKCHGWLAGTPSAETSNLAGDGILGEDHFWCVLVYGELLMDSLWAALHGVWRSFLPLPTRSRWGMWCEVSQDSIVSSFWFIIRIVWWRSFTEKFSDFCVNRGRTT